MKLRNMFGMAVLGLMAAACSNDVSEVLAPEAPALQGIPFTATIAPKAMDATTRALTESEDGLSAAWETGEEIALVYDVAGSYVRTKATVTDVTDGTATIDATLDVNVTDGTEVTLIYPYAASSEGTTNYSDPSVLSGYLYDSLLDTRTGYGTIKVTDDGATLKGGATLGAQYGIVKFEFESLAGTKLAMESLNIELGEDRVFSISTGGAANTILYAALPYLTDAELWFTAIDSDDKPYVVKATANIKVGKFYQTTLKMATLGDLMNSDGSFSAGAEDGKTPIGVIAYLGSDATVESTEDGGGHGLVLALKNAASEVKWSTNTETWEFGEEAAVDDLDALKRTTDVSGYTNTKTLMDRYTNGVNDCPAAFWSVEYSEVVPAPAGTTGWFLPSAQQWVKMMTGLGGLSENDIELFSWFDNKHTAADKWEAALEKAGEGNYDSMTDGWLWFWSSSEYYSQYFAVGVDIDATGTGDSYGFRVYSCNKGSTYSYYRVRSVLAF